MSLLEHYQREGSGLEGLLDAALLIRRAGCEHLVKEPPSLRDLGILAKAGEILEAERAYLFARAMRSPEEVFSQIDGGDAQVDAALERGLEKLAAKAVKRAS